MRNKCFIALNTQRFLIRKRLTNRRLRNHINIRNEITFLPRYLKLTSVILPLVKTEPAQNWITQTSLPHINALPTQRYKKFSTVCLVVCSVFAFCYTLFLSRVCLIYHLPTCECFCLSFFVCVSVCMYVLGESSRVVEKWRLVVEKKKKTKLYACV